MQKRKISVKDNLGLFVRTLKKATKICQSQQSKEKNVTQFSRMLNICSALLPTWVSIAFLHNSLEIAQE